MNLSPIIATAVGIGIYRGVVAPLSDRYRTWRNGPRIQVARRNWRGVYVPDLAIKRFERLIWLAFAGFIGLAAAIGWTVMGA